MRRARRVGERAGDMVGIKVLGFRGFRHNNINSHKSRNK